MQSPTQSLEAALAIADYTPRAFGLTFTRRLRKHKQCSHLPSLRTSIAIPRFLFARYLRTQSLNANDYLDAAILNTVPEDQALAKLIAREMLFPRAEEKAQKKSGAKDAPVNTDTTVKAQVVDDDPTAGILAEIESLDIDLAALDNLADAFEASENDDEDTFDAFDFFERLYSSADRKERALAELVVTFGGAGELEAYGANTLEKVELFVREMTLGHVGALTPEQVQWACIAGFAKELAHAITHPAELAGVLAGMGDTEALSDHLNARLQEAGLSELGRTLLFLKEAVKQDAIRQQVVDALADQARSKVKDLTGHAEFLLGMQAYEEPSKEVLEASLGNNIYRCLEAAKVIEKNFGEDIGTKLYELWSSKQERITLEQLSRVYVSCKRWKKDVDAAFKVHAKTMEPSDLDDNVRLASALQKTGIAHGALTAAKLATESLCIVDVKEEFLPLLDAFLNHETIPHDIERVIAAGQALGVDPDEIYDRIGDAVKQLYAMVMGDSRETERYKRLVKKSIHVPESMMQEMVNNASTCNNLEAMAALLAADMGGAAAHASDEFVSDALCYKGIGGGSNLLKQWFSSREVLRETLREQVKAQAKNALLDLAFEWINKGEGSSERGLIPQSHARPFRGGDDIDSLDIEATLDVIVNAGIGLDQVGEEHLYVSESSKGAAALLVLIDISGSMSARELAMCSIAVVMLLGKVRSEEVALAIFESDTHVIKTFDDGASLDVVADQVLDLSARGGTRVDAALRFAKDQFASVREAEFRLLFLLSDFYFFEEQDALDKLSQGVAEEGAMLVAASHGRYDEAVARRMVGVMGGRNIELKSAERLPEILIDTLRQIGDDAFR